MRNLESNWENDLARLIASDLNIPIYKAEQVLKSMKQQIARLVVKKEKVVFSGFGTFYAKIIAPRVGNRPKGGGLVTIPRRYEIKFKPSRLFSERVRKMPL